MAGEDKGSNAHTDRRQRLAAALRENLVKRKAQARARRAPADGDTTSDNNPSREYRSGNMLREDDEPSPSRE